MVLEVHTQDWVASWFWHPINVMEVECMWSEDHMVSQERGREYVLSQ